MPEPEIPDLKLHYNFDGDYQQVDDETGNYDAIAVGSDVVLEDGMAIFRGQKKTGLIDIPVDALRSENLTLTTLVYADETEEYGSLLEASRPDEGEGESATKYQIMKWIPRTGDNGNNNCISMTVRGPEGNERRVADQSTQMPVRQWAQLTYVQEGDQATLYLNGQKLDTKYLDKDQVTQDTGTTFSPADLTDGHRVTLGGGRYWDDPAFKGAVADFRIYDRALTGDEIAALSAYNLASDEAQGPDIRQNPNALVDIDLDNIIGRNMPNGGIGGRVLDGVVTNKDFRMTYGEGMFYTSRDTEWVTGMTFTQEGQAEIAQKVKTINVMVYPEGADTWGKIWDVGRNEWSGKREYVRMSWNEDYKGGKALRIAMQLCEERATAVQETHYYAVDAEGNPLNLKVNEWSMVTFTMDESGFTLYINGQPVQMEKQVNVGDAIDGGTFATLLDNPEVTFGGTASDFQEGFEGWYSHISMYETVLNAEEVAELYTTMPVKTFEDMVKAYTFSSYYDGQIKVSDNPPVFRDEMDTTYADTPWMNGITISQWMENVQAVGDTMLYYYANGQRLDRLMSGAHTGRTIGTQGEDGSHGPGLEMDGYPSQVANLNAPSYWGQADRLWANMSIPFQGVAFANNSYFAQLGTRYALTDNFVVDGTRYAVYWDSMASFDDSIEKVQKKYLNVGTELIDNKDLYPGSGLDSEAKKNAFRYVYAMYNYANRAGDMAESKYAGYPTVNVTDVEGVSYQAYNSPDGVNYISAKTADLETAFDMAKGVAQNIYMISGDMARALEAQIPAEGSIADAFKITGAPTAEAVTADGATTQRFANGLLKAVDGEYSFLSNEVIEAAEAVEEQIDAAANLENSADLEALRSKVEAAKTAYGELDATQQAMVDNYGKIAELEAGIAAVESVQEQISELPAVEDINEENAAENDVKVKAAQAAVEALAEYGKFISETDKQLLSDLEEAIKPYIKSDAVVAVEELIGAIPESDLTYKDAGAIWKAKHAYDALSAEDQGDVDATLAGKLTTAMEFAETLTVDDSKITDDVSSWNDQVNLSPWMNNSNLTQEEKLAVIETMRDENAFQYTHEGYDLGFQSTDLNRKMQVQEGLVYVEVDNSGDTKPGCNPWGQADRRWAAIVAPFEGVAFSIKSPFGYLGVGQSLLLSNTFEYNGRIYQLTWNEVHSYDASMSIDEITADYMQNKILDENGEPVAKSIEAIFPGMQTVEEVAEDVTNNTFRYAAARYNQAVKWDGKTLGIPSGEVVTGESVLYQKFEGPQGEAYIIGNKADVDLADANEPAAVAYVVTGEDLEAIKAVNADLGTAMETVGAPIEEKPEDGSAWRFTNGRIENGVFTAYTAIEKFELLLEKTVQTAMTDEAEYEAAKAAYEAAAAAYEALGSEQSEVPAESVERLENAGAMVEKYETDRAAADEMIERLNELPYRITDIDEAAEAEIASAREDYDDLNAEVKEMVGAATYDYLVEAEDTLAAKEFVDLYEGLQVPENYAEEWADLDPETYEESEEYLTYVAPLEEPYGALNDRQQDKVDEYDGEMLEAIEALLAWRPDVDDIVLGDLDKDGEVTIADVMEACKVMARESAGTDPTDEEIERGDMDGDSEITIADVMEICKVLARQSA